MLVALIVAAALAAGALVLLWLTHARANQLTAERDDLTDQLGATESALERTEQRLAGAEERLTGAEARIAELDAARLDLAGRNRQLQARIDELTSHLDELAARNVELTTHVEDTSAALRKRTELADAQALQIDAISAERDDLRQQLTSAEERIVTLAARPGIVVGELSTDESNAEMLWDLELARSERSWRNSVAINPVADTSPFETAEDPTRTAVEIEASALREDVGALIDIDWRAPPIESASRRLLVVRVAQEMLASASRAPGAAKLVVTPSGEGDGELKLRFESADESDGHVNVIAPQLTGELVDIENERGLSVTVKAE